jgi:hypothetical protein
MVGSGYTLGPYLTGRAARVQTESLSQLYATVYAEGRRELAMEKVETLQQRLAEETLQQRLAEETLQQRLAEETLQQRLARESDARREAPVLITTDAPSQEVEIRGRAFSPMATLQ